MDIFIYQNLLCVKIKLNIKKIINRKELIYKKLIFIKD